MSSLRFVFFLFILTFPSLCFANNQEKKANFGILNGYELYFKKYAKKYRLITWDGKLNTLQQALSLNKVPVDLIMLNKKIADQACDLNLLVSFPNDFFSDTKQCELKTFTDHITLAWDNEKIHFNPTWKDFWNITQYPGKRGLQKDAFSALSIALMADNVPAEDVIDVLSTPSGISRALKKLNQLRPYIVWWSSPNEANFLLHHDQVLMTSASVLSIIAFQQKHPDLQLQFQHHNTIENSVVIAIPATIQTKRIKLIQNILKKYPLIPFSSSDLSHQKWYQNIEQTSLFKEQASIPLEKIFNEWLQLPIK